MALPSTKTSCAGAESSTSTWTPSSSPADRAETMLPFLRHPGLPARHQRGLGRGDADGFKAELLCQVHRNADRLADADEGREGGLHRLRRIGGQKAPWKDHLVLVADRLAALAGDAVGERAIEGKGDDIVAAGIEAGGNAALPRHAPIGLPAGIHDDLEAAHIAAAVETGRKDARLIGLPGSTCGQRPEKRQKRQACENNPPREGTGARPETLCCHERGS